MPNARVMIAIATLVLSATAHAEFVDIVNDIRSAGCSRQTPAAVHVDRLQHSRVRLPVLVIQELIGMTRLCHAEKCDVPLWVLTAKNTAVPLSLRPSCVSFWHLNHIGIVPFQAHD